MKQRFKHVPARERFNTLMHRRTHGYVRDANVPADVLSARSIVLGGVGAGNSSSEHSKHAYLLSIPSWFYFAIV